MPQCIIWWKRPQIIYYLFIICLVFWSEMIRQILNPHICKQQYIAIHNWVSRHTSINWLIYKQRCSMTKWDLGILQKNWIISSYYLEEIGTYIYFFYSFATFFNCNFVNEIMYLLKKNVSFTQFTFSARRTSTLSSLCFLPFWNLLQREKEYLHNILSFHFDGKNRVALHQNCKQGFDGSIMYRHTY